MYKKRTIAIYKFYDYPHLPHNNNESAGDWLRRAKGCSLRIAS